MCGISFRTRELLKQHQEREHNECPRFACETCGMRFGNNYHLRRHEVIHTNEELPCPLCSRRFKRKDGLDTHMSHIHGVSNQDYSTQIMENTYAKSPLQDTPSDIGEEDNNEKSFTELISYDSLYTQKEFLGTENPFITPSALSVEQFGEENYFSDETMELKVKSQSILSHLESLSQHPPLYNPRSLKGSASNISKRATRTMSWPRVCRCWSLTCPLRWTTWSSSTITRSLARRLPTPRVSGSPSSGLRRTSSDQV